MYDRTRWPWLLMIGAIPFWVVSFASTQAAQAFLDEALRLGDLDPSAAGTLLGLSAATVEFARVLIYVSTLLVVAAAVVSFVNRKWPPEALPMEASIDNIRAAVARITATATEVGDIEAKRKKMAAQQADLDALLSTSEAQRKAVLAQSGTKKWTLISLGVGIAITLALFGYSEFVADRL